MFTYHTNVAHGTDSVDLFFVPTDADGAAIAGWTDTYIDVFYVDSNGDVIVVMTDQQMTENASALGYAVNKLFWYQWDQAFTSLPSDVRTVCIVFKNAADDAANKHMGTISLNREADAATDFAALGERQTWLRNTIDNVVVPRLKRALGLLGENLVLDQFEYDDAGNIEALRMRIFENATSAEAATEDITGALEDGEIARYTISQTTDLPKNLRSFHLSSIDTDQDDSTATENSEVRSDPVNASGNTGSWPSGVSVIN